MGGAGTAAPLEKQRESRKRAQHQPRPCSHHLHHKPLPERAGGPRCVSGECGPTLRPRLSTGRHSTVIWQRASSALTKYSGCFAPAPQGEREGEATPQEPHPATSSEGGAQLRLAQHECTATHGSPRQPLAGRGGAYLRCRRPCRPGNAAPTAQRTHGAGQHAQAASRCSWLSAPTSHPWNPGEQLGGGQARLPRQAQAGPERCQGGLTWK